MNKRYVLAVFFLLIVTALAFLPALKCGFTNWDDDKIVTKSPLVTQLSWENVKRIATSFHYHHYHPLVTFSLAVEYRIFTLNPFPYHLINLVLHLCNTLLVFWLVMLLSSHMTVAFLCAILFGIHPLHVESVAWIAERKDVMYAFFYLFSLIAYAYYLTRQKKQFYAAALILFLLSLLSKAMAMTLPVVLFLIGFLLRRPMSKKTFLDTVPFFILAAIFGVIALFSHYPATNLQNTFAITCIDKMIIAGYSILFYLYKMIVPTGLSCIYPYPQLFEWISFWYCPLICLFLAVIALVSLRYTRILMFGMLFFIITLLPVLQFFPVGHTIVADRFTYIPLIGIFFILAEGIWWIYEKIKTHAPLRIVYGVSLVCAGAVLTIITWHQVQIWHDSFSLWNHVIRQYPTIAIAYNNRGNILNNRGEWDRAITDFNRALELDPLNFNVYNNRGYAYNGKKELERAVADFSKAIEIDPACATAYNNRGNIYNLTGRFADALADYDKAIQYEPDNPGTYNNRGVVYFAQGDFQNALVNYNEALKRRPDFAEAYINRGKVFCAMGAFENGISDYTRSLLINPHLAAGYYLRAQAYCATKEYDKAWGDVQRIYELGFQPDQTFLNTLRTVSGREAP